MTFTYFDRMFVLACAGAAVAVAGGVNLYLPRLGVWRRVGMTAGVCGAGLLAALALTHNPGPVAAVGAALMAAVAAPCLALQAWLGGREPVRMVPRAGWAVAVTVGLFAIDNAGVRYEADDREWVAGCMKQFDDEYEAEQRQAAADPDLAAERAANPSAAALVRSWQQAEENAVRPVGAE